MLDDDDNDFSTTTVSAGQLRAIVERIERLEEEKKEVSEQIKEVYAEAKGNLRYVPVHIRKERALGLELVKKFYAFHGLLVEEPAAPEPEQKAAPEKVPCPYCGKKFTPRGLPRHMQSCSARPTEEVSVNRFAAPAGEA